MHYFALVTCLLFLLKGAVAGNTIYVSSNSGSDSNDGSSETNPVETLRKASDLASLMTDTNIFLERNSTWIEESIDVTSSGAISVSAYGDETLPRPLIQHGRHVFQNSFCVGLSLLSNQTFSISNLHLSGCSTGLILSPKGSSIPVDGVVQQNVFTDIKSPMLKYSPPNPAWSVAINLDSGTFQNLTIRNNVGARLDVFFSSTAYVNGMNLDSNTVQFCQGNCYSIGIGENIMLQNSVFLNDIGTRLFMYGVTDVIIGGLKGGTFLNNDFNARGEYIGGPDGCAIDFETSSSGTSIIGNTISKSYGGGIMIFGHDTTSQNISISENVFDRAGCVQNRGDSGGIAVMCPNNQHPSAKIYSNTFLLCDDDTPAINSPSADPECPSKLDMKNNTIQTYSTDLMVQMPQLSLNPPSPDSTDTSGKYNVLGVTKTKGAVVRYTTDGSRPTESSLAMPAKGLDLKWPGKAVQINLRAFKSGMIPSITNGALLELNYVLGREAPDAAHRGPGAGTKYFGIGSSLDGANVVDESSIRLNGWVVDCLNQGFGIEPVVIKLSVDFATVQVLIAREPRPDLVTAGVAPDPNHGFDFTLKNEILLSSGRHVLEIHSIGSKSAASNLLAHVICIDGSCNVTRKK